MKDIDFHNIVPRCGGKREAFEELCCQLAHRSCFRDASYKRLHGAGGDGGVECYADLSDGTRIGLQAKYVFNINSLLTQVKKSLATALEVHPTLTRYIVCFPFDLTGPTRRGGSSSHQKFDAWKKQSEERETRNGRQLLIESWPASKLRALFIENDRSGGLREFFFNKKILTDNWFSEHLESAKKTAGPRYVPELNVETKLWKWFASFGRTIEWEAEFRRKIHACHKEYRGLVSNLNELSSDPLSTAWPENLRDEAQYVTREMKAILDQCDRLVTVDDLSLYNACVSQLNNLIDKLVSLESELAEDLKARYGEGAINPGFRQFMAEYQNSFPLKNLDCTRDAIVKTRDLGEWFNSPECFLSYERIFMLSGVFGSGKTHGVCDTATRRFSKKLLTCLTFGHQFRGEADPWTRFLETLKLPASLGAIGLLDALNAAGEASGAPLIIFVDAINETRPLRYWRDRLSSVSDAVKGKPYLRLCITCRSSFIASVLPDGSDLKIVEHPGFAGSERDACQAFFQYYNLEPPIAPILQPELSNPLYLQLLCKSLRSRGLLHIPLGWVGLAPTIRAYLQENERQFAADYETSEGSQIVTGCLVAIVREIVNCGSTVLPKSEAERVISEARPQAKWFPVLDWLVRADLLIEDAPVEDAPLGSECTLRPAFERLGDFLVAEELMSRMDTTDLLPPSQPGEQFNLLWRDSNAVDQNRGILSALSILVPEQHPGLELPNLVADGPIRLSLMQIALQSIPWRNPSTFSSELAALIQEALSLETIAFDAMEATLATSWQHSTIDAIWLDRLFKQLPLANRDAVWCPYLHKSFNLNGTIKRLIDAAFELPLGQLGKENAERWATVLLWFTAAADRRIKDRATRAITAVVTAHPKVIPQLLQRFIDSGDDKVLERAILSCLGALIVSRDKDVITTVTRMLGEAYTHFPEAYANALIRDHIRCLSELAQVLNALHEDADPMLTMQPMASEWPLALPSDEEIQGWGNLPKLVDSCLEDDFFVYSMGCLQPWMHAISKIDMGKWILQRVAHDFAYEGSGCERYEINTLAKYGGGRSKPIWAERIGKKYQWIAMYQLASRLHDHVDRQQDSWEPEPLRTPMILLEERKLDPTLPPSVMKREPNPNPWWILGRADLASTEDYSDEEWATMIEDVPALETLLSKVERNGQNWRLLVGYPTWQQTHENADQVRPYRQLWMQIHSYLVQKQDFSKAYKCLQRRNFWGRWMPEGASWSYGFAGEYPWATPFNTEPERWHGRKSNVGDLPFQYLPVWNNLDSSWEYDASLSGYNQIIVPARELFCNNDLWWDGQDGFLLGNGRTVFRDPSIIGGKSKSLLGDTDELLKRLDRLGWRLFWTVLGEKWIINGPRDQSLPRRPFSQTAYLKTDGNVITGERVFFKDYNQDVGPGAVI